MSIILFYIISIALLVGMVWHNHKEVMKQWNNRRALRNIPNTDNTQRNTQHLSTITDNKTINPHYIRKPFDRDLYNQIMAESKSNIVSEYQIEMDADLGIVDTDILEMILPDTMIKATDTKQNNGILMRRLALAKEKQKQDTESIAIKVSDTLSCDKCSYKAKNIKALNGHRKAHR